MTPILSHKQWMLETHASMKPRSAALKLVDKALLEYHKRKEDAQKRRFQKELAELTDAKNELQKNLESWCAEQEGHGKTWKDSVRNRHATVATLKAALERWVPVSYDPNWGDEHPRLCAAAEVLGPFLYSAAVRSRANFANWSQYVRGAEESYMVWLQNGMCHGLAIAFLACCKAGEDFSEVVGPIDTDFVIELTDENGQKNKLSSVRATVLAAHTAGNIGLKSETQNERDEEEYLRKLGLEKHGATQIFKDHTRAGEFCEKKTFYYLVSTTHHAMAVAAGPGDVRFFDPNCGIVSVPSNRLKKLFVEYFGSPYVQSKYGSGNKVELKVRRYS